jgi:hypothetical protein
MSAQELKELEHVVSEADQSAAGPEAATPGPDSGGGTSPAADPVSEAEAIFTLVVNVASVGVPLIGERYGQGEIRRIAEAYVPVAQKHGWDLNLWLARYALELALIYAVVAPVAKDLVTIARARMAAKKPDAKEQANARSPDAPLYKPMADAQAHPAT